MSVPYGRSLPARPDLEQQKKQAKALLQDFERGDPVAAARIRASLPDKARIRLADAQFVLAREYGFESWAALKDHIEHATPDERPSIERFRRAVEARDAGAVRRVLDAHPDVRARIDEPLFSFDSPALVHIAGSASLDLIDVLLAAGADPNRRSDWWAGGFHPLHTATGIVAERLMAAGAIPDACAAAHLDRVDLLRPMLEAEPQRVHERGGDGQTPLHFARSRAVVDLLLDAGADLDARDLDHRATPAQWMLDRSRNAGRYALAAYLVERGASADILLAAALGLTGRVTDMVRADPSLLDARTHQGEYGEKPPSSYHIYTWTIGQNLSAIEVAAHFGHADTLNALLALSTPRHRFVVACALGDDTSARALLREHPDLVESLRPDDHRALPDAGWRGDARAVELMLQLGFDPTAVGSSGGTVLHNAAWEGNVACVNAVLRHRGGRALIATRENLYGQIPLGWCCHGSIHCGTAGRDHATVARLLLEAGSNPPDGEATASPEVQAVIGAWRRRA